ncbi:aminotransferase class V-fold PLP-dependent enzyme [Paenibacillus filicis]|uniref:Aminotransferase class V-fold PLP-dependent enzyme n=1 Tax=Paenibacillus gyeongsangnamensis TaxID=3388067 RepID=A0ABT4QKX2_9BACL|nr:aminotransferase class I/II-fold pyridoxal phosphate-dependent enzyme [Paenibacillus filicis]MCZ8517523.1 aminotransferase class V-fold PLP-dependent enzyme [Paenibacillus filicis]
MSQQRAPLFESLLAHRGSRAVSFHVPGHKSDAGVYVENEEASQLYEQILTIDLTEIPGLDDLHQPEEAIHEAQQLAADCFGAEETLFLVGGSTVGNLAMILAHCRPGERLLVQRDAHKSVIHGLMLAGAEAVFIAPQVDAAGGMRLGLDPDNVEEALRRYPDAVGLLLTNPNYFGIGSDLAAIADKLHARGKLLLVDEAHGAHYGFHPALPQSALACGADAVVQSTHKMLAAMTMGAMLHLQGSRVHRDGIKRVLAMLQSSSPSYPLMASLDLSRTMLQASGRERIGRGLQAVARLEEGLEAIGPKGRPRWQLWSMNGGNESYSRDPFKLALFDSTGQWDGYELKRRLEEQGCYPEMTDGKYVLLVYSLASTIEDSEKLLQALRRIEPEADGEVRDDMRNSALDTSWLARPDRVSEPVSFDMGHIRGFERDIKWLPIGESAGYAAAEMIIPYPPGIPLLYPGEIISSATAAELEMHVRGGSRFHGHDLSKDGKIAVRVAPSHV